jgi:predicted permease
VESNTVSDGYLSTLRIPLIAGRDLTAADSRPGAPPVALVSENLAQLLYPNENAVGQRLVYGDQAGDRDVLRIVGIVREARYFGLREKPAPMVYTALDPQLNRLVLCVRTEGAPEQFISAVRAAVAEIDPAVPVLEAATMADRLNRESAGLRLLTMLLGGFGAMALVLAAIGLHGVLACGVAERTREIGIRAALGARRGDAVARVLGDVWKLVAAGVAIGSMAALAAVRLLAGFLFGVQPLDTVSFAWAIGVLLAVAALAGCLPARRAAGVDPAVALRHD